MTFRKIQVFIIIGILFFVSQNAFCEWKGCIYDYAKTGEKSAINIIIGKFCGPGSPSELVVESLNLTTGEYKTIMELKNNLPYDWWFDTSQETLFTISKHSYSINAVSLNTGLVAATFTLDNPAGTDWDDFITGLNMLFSPDGSRIYINGEIFDGHTYKLINQDIPFSNNVTFSPDSKRIYYTTYDIDKSVNPANLIPRIDIFDAHTSNLISTIDYKKILNAYPQFPINLSSKRSNLDFPNIGNVRNGEFVSVMPVILDRGPNCLGYVYNIQTGAVSPTATIACDTRVSDNGKWWITDHYHKKLIIYNISTGKKVAGFDISSPTGKGAIISWPDDHTFIYNTTQQLIYFDIKQNKIIKQIPIIRPWEQKGWKPQVG